MEAEANSYKAHDSLYLVRWTQRRSAQYIQHNDLEYVQAQLLRAFPNTGTVTLFPEAQRPRAIPDTVTYEDISTRSDLRRVFPNTST